ncbi:MAG: hypothetical protein ACRCUS_04160, partial [Anaerovoracaceae bacterium]
VSISIVEYSLILYTIFSFLAYCSLYSLIRKKTQLIDIICTLSIMTLALIVSFLSILLIPNYWIALAITQIILLAIPFILRKVLPKLYANYCRTWNVGGSLKIKSITVRNISVVVFNAMVLATNYSLIYVLTYKGGV